MHLKCIDSRTHCTISFTRWLNAWNWENKSCNCNNSDLFTRNSHFSLERTSKNSISIRFLCIWRNQDDTNDWKISNKEVFSRNIAQTQFQKGIICIITNQDDAKELKDGNFLWKFGNPFAKLKKKIMEKKSISIRYSPDEEEIKRWSNRIGVRTRNTVFLKYLPIFLGWSLRWTVIIFNHKTKTSARNYGFGERRIPNFCGIYSNFF